MSALARDAYAAEVTMLREQVETQAQTIHYLKALLAPCVIFPRAWRLSPGHRKVLAALYGAPDGYRSAAALHQALYDGEPLTDPQIVRCYVSMLRRALPWLEIEAVTGRGYRLRPASRAIIALALASDEPRQ